MNPVSVYLHIPFCSTKCTYCAFNTYVNLENLIQPFTLALAHELSIVGQSHPGQQVHTVFFGGGTPSLLSHEQLTTVLDALNGHFEVKPDAEITLEANPSDLSRDYLIGLRRLGVNRLSIGMQSSNGNELMLFGRRHDNDAVVRAVSAARWAGFDNLNLDLIYGAPHQTLESWEATLRQTVALQPEHISLYALGLEEGTSMKAWVDRGRLPAPDDDLTADMYDLATECLGGTGYNQYEISNWAKPGRECRHNLQYWHNEPYVGVGPGAHGWAGGVRYATLLSPHRYVQAMRDADSAYPYPYTPATEQATVVDRDAEIAETLMMGLRLTREGIEWNAFCDRFGVDLRALHGATLDKFTRLGLLEADASKVRLTEQGRLLSNMVFRELV